ncbi:glycoside hydrolase family 73 protein [Dickeya zeae]|uniref:glycoside hydrolase family 73 protein n=1 Tax=Dickeya zeae TaxID=204042 RepID=UPI0021D5AF91|nr:glucosaminidase domain-containing protein [Dickeya zeae]
MKKNNTTRKQLFVVIKKTRSFTKKTEINSQSRQNNSEANNTASGYSVSPATGLDNIRSSAPESARPSPTPAAASQPTPPTTPPVTTVPPLPKFSPPQTPTPPVETPTQPAATNTAPPSQPTPAPTAAAPTTEPAAPQEPANPPSAPDYAAAGSQLSKLMSGMAAPLSRLTSSLQGFTSQSLLKSATPKPADNTGASPSRVDSISLPTAPAQKINMPIPAGRSGTIQRALATGAAYKQGNIEGLDDAHTRALVASTAATESAGGKLDIRNSAGYLGRYQAGAGWLAEAGLIAGGANAVVAAMKADGFTNEYKWGKSGGMTRFLKNKNNWKNGLDYDKYLSSAEIQDNAFKTNSDKAYAYLVKKGIIKPGMTQNEIAGILKARHIGGIGGAIKAAKNIEGPKDANGTSALKYKNDLADGNVFIESYQSGNTVLPEPIHARLDLPPQVSNAKKPETKKTEVKNTSSKGQKPKKLNLSKENRDFVEKIYKEALSLETETGVPAAITAAQAILESGYGKRVPVDINTKEVSNNLFGIKANDKYIKNGGKYVNILTTEYVPVTGEREKKKIKIVGKFRAYQSSEDSLRDHASFLRGNKRYKDLFNSKNPMKWAEGLQASGYATDPEYAKKLQNVILKFGWDKKDDNN